MNDELKQKTERLLELIRSFESCAVAFSAGVDSTVVAKAAQLALGDRAVAVTGVSASLANGELAEAKQLAEQIGIRHATVATEEQRNPNYARNASDRCYHCKTELYRKLDGLSEKFNVAVTLSGANADDAGDYRPGMKAATDQGVRSPLLECGFTKSEVRALAEAWDLPVWDKPAAPCLASRVAYGVEVTPERLMMIDRAESFLKESGLADCRVRCHDGDLARIEVLPNDVPKLARSPFREELIARLKALGFKFISLDLEGFRSGSLNTILPLETLNRRT
jgi:uncharacterized protein